MSIDTPCDDTRLSDVLEVHERAPPPERAATATTLALLDGRFGSRRGREASPRGVVSGPG